MPFTVKRWENGASGGTRLNAEALQDLETRLSGYTDSIVSAQATRIAQLEARVEELAVIAGGINEGFMRSTTDAYGDWWLTANAERHEDGSWHRLDESRFAYAMHWIINGVIPGEEAIDPIGGVVFWRAVPMANPINPAYGSWGGWELVYLFTQYRDIVLGGTAIEVDGSGTFPFGRVIHGPAGTFLTKNAYVDLNGRDDPTKDSLMLGMFGDLIKARLWPANVPKEEAVDLFTVDKAGNLHVKGTVTEG